MKCKIDLFEFEVEMFTKKSTCQKQISYDYQNYYEDAAVIPDVSGNDGIMWRGGTIKSWKIGVFDNELSTLVHELFHVVESMGRTVDISDSETQAHIIGYLFKSFQKGVRPKLAKNIQEKE
jgi:hypothetical protein